MGTIKGRNGMDLREAEDTKKGWQQYTKELYKKDLHDPDKHDGMITHLQADILECKVKWVLGSTGFPGGSDGKASARNVGDPDSIPGLGRSLGEGNGNPLQYSCLENPMDRGAGKLQSMRLQRVGHD